MTPTPRTSVTPSLLFHGRPGDVRLGQWVKPVEAPLPVQPAARKGSETIVVFGCPDDLGVTSNRGRAGARLGPDTIRKHLYKMTPPMDLVWEEAIELWDYGNLIPAGDIVETHKRARAMAAEIAANGFTVVLLGGGHDFAAPGFTGFMEGRACVKTAARKQETFGLINIDPHLDVRPLENGKPHSGTPFRQLLDAGELKGKHFTAFGARAARNSRDHYAYARHHAATVLTLEALREKRTPVERQFASQLARLSRQVTSLGVTFDMDACADAEGTSAAPVVGFSAWELVRMAAQAGATKRARYLEIAEVAPELEPSERSARIAAEMIFAFLRARAEAR